ncbi:MAG TPA: hypothetical protein VF507_01675 [Pyrinomonadaceae bacterium]|jgi:DNA-binding NtrC family response regulator
MNSTQKLAILYFDDDRARLDSLLRVFGGRHEVSTVANLGEARRALNARSFDLVISGQAMAEISRGAFLREAAEAQPYSFRVMLTSDSDAWGMLRGIKEGVIHFFIGKPWVEESMRMAVEMALTHRMKSRAPAKLSFKFG